MDPALADALALVAMTGLAVLAALVVIVASLLVKDREEGERRG